jgi:hypothetical protein
MCVSKHPVVETCRCIMSRNQRKSMAYNLFVWCFGHFVWQPSSRTHVYWLLTFCCISLEIFAPLLTSESVFLLQLPLHQTITDSLSQGLCILSVLSFKSQHPTANRYSPCALFVDYGFKSYNYTSFLPCRFLWVTWSPPHVISGEELFF